MPVIASAQTDIATIKHKRCKLKGKWLLVKTFSMGSMHETDTINYNDVIKLKCFSRFEEEVFYESIHWIIKGKWKVKRKGTSFVLSKRRYTVGVLEQNPQDLHLTLETLDKNNYSVSGIANGEAVKMFYKRLKKQK